MNKEMFLQELRRRLSGLPLRELEERIGFYREMIEDSMEDGLIEEEAVQRVGTVDSVVEQIMAEIPLSTLVMEKVKPARALKAWEILLLVLGAPLWIPLLVAAAAIVLSLYVVIWTVVICLFATDLSLASGVVAGLFGVASFLRAWNPGGILLSLGIGLACAGLAILLFFASVRVAKEIVKLTGQAVLAVKTSIVGKEN